MQENLRINLIYTEGNIKESFIINLQNYSSKLWSIWRAPMISEITYVVYIYIEHNDRYLTLRKNIKDKRHCDK